MSECDHYETSVRRNNFIQLWLNEQSADAFIATHLYGAMQDLTLKEMPESDLDDVLNTSMQQLN